MKKDEKLRRHLFNRNDIILIVSLLLVAGALILFIGKRSEAGARAIVYVDGDEVASYSLNTNARYELNGGTNSLVIENGEAWLEAANCPDKLCVKQGHIRYSGQSIVCLPNKLVVMLEGAETVADIYVG